MRRLAILIVAGLALSACGEAPATGPEPRVKLRLELPTDGGMVRTDNVEVRGTVTPADAAVQVAGENAQVDGGQFVAKVTLTAGDNVIDVTATSPGRRPATDALRIKRDMRVEVPPLTGKDYDEAAAALKRIGLKATEQPGGSWLDRVLGSAFTVCASSPAAGSLVQPSTTVTLATGPNC